MIKKSLNMSIFKHSGSTLIVLLVLLFFVPQMRAQKVGLVLSGGAASGIAHIGVLKALEENNVPVDYITGTSMGALIGCLYASGYSPAEIQEMVKSERFRNWSEGIIDQKYAYYFKRAEDNASWVTIKLDSTIINALPTNLISPVAMDFGMMELTSQASAVSRNNFDSLFVPFRCVASDVERKESVIFRSGDLAQSVRASMSYPFYIKPIMIDGKLLFDGGLYNNFPSNVMLNDFYPDFMIGSNVSGNNPPPDEDNVLSQIRSMLQSKSDYSILCEAGVIIEPTTDVGLFNFRNVQPLIDSGYVAAMREMDFILNNTQRRVTAEELAARRKQFRDREPQVLFNNINIVGLNNNQAEYARKILRHGSSRVSLDDMKEGYFRLASDNKIKYINPRAQFDPATGYFDLFLRIKKERDIITTFGGNFSNRPISTGFIGFQYNYLGRFASSINADAYFGKLYSAVQVKTRFDFPFRTPVYIEPGITWNKWDYYKSSNAFLEDVRPAYLKQSEEYTDLHIGFPTGKKGRIVGGASYFLRTDRFYQTNVFSGLDTADRTDFQGFAGQAYYEVNSLNRKQYANQGEYLMFKIKYINGEERHDPGTTSLDSINDFSNYQDWLMLKLSAERYFNRRGSLKFGFLGEAVYSTQGLFSTYTSSILAAPAFQPTPDSKTVFLEEYRTHKYLAGGMKIVVNLQKTVEMRAEFYIFQPYEAILKTKELKAKYSLPFDRQHYIGTAGLVWHTPVGPMSLSVNYYDQERNPFSILFHFGYIMFHKRALD
jgi:NTE family protein